MRLSSLRTRAVRAAATVFAICLASTARGADFELLVGVDAGMTPGGSRLVFPIPGPGFPSEFFDGDRLAGTDEDIVPAEYLGLPEPLFEPNEFGALSYTFRRGSVPVTGMFFPILAIDYLGGPRLDLDGDLNNGSRSLIPVVGVDEPAIIPGGTSFVSLDADLDNLTIELLELDVTSTNPGAEGIQAGIATTVNVLAGTASGGAPGEPINPTVDTRVGELTPYAGDSGLLEGVWRVEHLGYEIWQDSIDPNSSSASVLGTLQFLGTFRGWLVSRDPATGQFPALAGEGLGGTLWPAVNEDYIGQTFSTANGLVGGSATIVAGAGDDRAGDIFTEEPAAEELIDFGGDIGAYFDNVVIPLLDASQHSFVYLEAAGAGINNSFDPVFGDTVSWDVVLIGASACGLPLDALPGDLDGNFLVNLDDYGAFQTCFGGSGGPVGMECDPADIDGDGDVDLIDFGGFQDHFGDAVQAPACEL